MIFDNKKNKKLEVSFDDKLEVYSVPSKADRQLKKPLLRKKSICTLNSDNCKEFQSANGTSNNITDKFHDKELENTIIFSNPKEANGILINDIEKTGAINNDELNHKANITLEKSEQVKAKYHVLFKDQEKGFSSFADKNPKQTQENSLPGKQMEDLIGMFFNTSKDTTFSKNESKNLDMNKNYLKTSDGIERQRSTMLTNNIENKHDFLCYAVKECGKIFNENKNTDNDTSDYKSQIGDNELSDEENNYSAYCQRINFKCKPHTEPKKPGTSSTNEPDSPQSAIKSKNYKFTEYNNKCLEFRRTAAKQQSELDKDKLKEESERLENLTTSDIPAGKTFLSDIIFFNENRKGMITNRTINHAQRTGSLMLTKKSLTDVSDIIRSLNVKEYKFSSESTKTPDKWHDVLKTVIDLNLSFDKLKLINPKGTSVCSIKELRLNNNRIKELPGEIGLLQFLSYLNLSYNHLRCLPLKMCSLKNLKEINLRRNFLEKLPDTFGNLINLEKLDLSFNKMNRLPATFVCLNCLKSLNLSFNELAQLPMRMMYLKKLENMDLSYNYISELPPMIEMGQLIFIDLTCNRIRHFPKFSGCTHLTELRLGINRIKEIVIENLYQCPLLNLLLPHNKIKEIPDDIFLLTRLEILDASDNLITMLPWSLAKLQHLNYININNNNIINMKKSTLLSSTGNILKILRKRLILYEGKDSQLHKQLAENKEKRRKECDPEEIIEMGKGKNKDKRKQNKRTGKMKDKGTGEEEIKEFVKKPNKSESSVEDAIGKILKSSNLNKADLTKSLTTNRSLVCKEMNLSELSTDLIKLASQYKVLKIDLSNNNFCFVPTRLKYLSNHLQELILSNNNLKTIPDFCGTMIHLSTLDVSNNQLESLPLSMCESNLRTINARNNYFTKIPKALYSAYSLEHVNFSRNKIKVIEVSGIKNWKRLSYLNLRNNLIEEVPCELGFLVNIRTLDLSDNPLKDINHQIIKGGTASLLKYLRSISFKEKFGNLKHMVLF